MLQVLIGLAWIGGSLFAVVCLVKPLRPIRSRKQALAAIAAIQVGFVATALVMPPPKPPAPPMDERAPVAKAELEAAATTPPTRSPFANGPARKEDAEAVRVKMKAGLETLEAAYVVLEQGLKTQDASLVQEADSAAMKVAFAMTRDREPLIGTDIFEQVQACDRAAYKLSELARSARRDGLSVEATNRRMQMHQDYVEQHEVCAIWVRQ